MVQCRFTYGTRYGYTPHDPSMLDNADVEYSYDPSTYEKEDVENHCSHKSKL